MHQLSCLTQQIHGRLIKIWAEYDVLHSPLSLWYLWYALTANLTVILE